MTKTEILREAPDMSDGGSAWPKFLLRQGPASLLAVTITALVSGLLGHWLGKGAAWPHLVMATGTIAALVALSYEIATSLRQGKLGLDVIAALSMAAALWFGEYLASTIVAVMYAGGQFLEHYAQRRAESGMTELLSHAPRLAVRVTETGLLEVPIKELAIGERLLIRSGDVVPVDGRVISAQAFLNEAALTGESFPVRRELGETVMSGASNTGDAFEMLATSSAGDSTYAGIIRMVMQARNSKAEMSRLADRYAIGFLALTLAIAGLAVLLTGDPVRLVAVLVVATPCPLILAVPVAMVAGMSKAARAGVLVKGANVLEALASVAVVVFDKTGTLTAGEPTISRIETELDSNELLSLVASLDQASGHSIARMIVEEARIRGLALSKPSEVTEQAGEGIEGLVGDRRVAVGGRRFIAERIPAKMGLATRNDPAVRVYVAVDGVFVGTIMMKDAVRLDASTVIAALRRSGVRRLCLATGDRPEVAAPLAQRLGLDAFKADLSPATKVDVVKAEQRFGCVLMIGDGINDAPALAAADIGLAVGRRNLAAAAEAADAVLLTDDLTQIGAALAIARRSRLIALQSVVAGISLSACAMVAAAFGYLEPVQGALLQEVIDVAVIVNALRAL